MFILIYFLITLIINVNCKYVIISSKLSNVTFRYLGDVNGESDLRECNEHEACNVVHNRFWMSTLTERLCQCPRGKECPWEWSTKWENYSIPLNNKSLLRFCSPVTEMDTCTYKRQAASVYGKSDTKNSYLIPDQVIVNCVCPNSRYWRLQKYTYEGNSTITQIFKCAKKRMCDTREFCGHIRSDTFSSYYRCTCPQNHLCIFKDKDEENVQELLYSGPAYKAYCLPFKG